MDVENSKNQEKGRISKKVLSLALKKKIIPKIEDETIDFEDLLRDYGIKTPLPVTLRNWKRQIERAGDAPFLTRKHFPEDLKRDIVRQVEMGVFSEEEAVVKYGITSGKRQLDLWLKQYSSDITTVSKIEAMSGQEESENAALKRKQKEFEKALEQANLKVIGLETMIDIAEKQFKISIRKKSGSKQ